jgi:hypothetical protein
MEEATELFALQQRIIARSRATPATPPGPEPRAREKGSETPRARRETYDLTDDRIWEGLLLFGPAAGILAAILKRSREPGVSPSPASTASSRGDADR